MYEAKYQKYITKSNSRFSEPEEVIAHAIPLSNNLAKNASGIPLYYSSNKTLYVDNEDNHTLVVKSRELLFLQPLLQLSMQERALL